MILVTGATGLSGSAVIHEFAQQKAPVRALVRNRANAQDLEALPTVEVVEGDMLRPETLKAALRDVDRVLMISSASKRMVQTQCMFIDEAREAGISHIIKFSGKESGIGFNPNHFRSTWEHEHIEDYLEHSGLAWTHLRPSQFMQFYLPPAPTAVNVAKSALLLPMENARLSPVDVEDIAKVAFALLHSEGHEGKSYDMTGPEALTMAEVVEQISQAIGKPFRYVNIPLEEMRQAWLAAGIPTERVDTISEVLSERIRCVDSRVTLDTHKMFGVRPTTFAEFARRNAAVFRGETMPL
ncbi:NAD(P)-dependent oxidoreductase [Ktedonobacter sp. SOSP1-52]|uniref:SDR family oxidoreductase n=1 Tax=Ktedonobacter sp. SOSP1-52 TaxID=2778366 RepID=UPI0019152C2F|nr:SDR family oxidoreductase [Ktedonobacter sp. SOSP1-52]GHO69275.1 NAD(P)-dependent oxidoreductase [Ktedonobacter sp. SOSP1-52]